MTLRLSTGLRDKMLGLQASPIVCSNSLNAGTLAYVDGGASSDTITDSNSQFVIRNLAPGMKIYCFGSTTAANDTAFAAGITLTGVSAGTLTFATSTVNTAENFAATTFLVACAGGSVKDIFHDGVLRIYSGSQPATADTAASGTLLLEITQSAGAFTHGAFDNALEFGAAASGAISKSASETWQDTGIAAGTAGWFRLCANPTDSGALSTSLPRIDGSVGTSGADLNMSSTTITVGSTYTIDTFTLTLPAYYGA